MATAMESRVVYAAGAAQGIVLVTFPAASTIFTSPHEYGLTNSQYGVLFVPQVVTAITASLLGAGLGRRFGIKRIYLAGLTAGLVAMALLLLSALVESHKSVAFPLLLVATAFVGVGFGLTVPALNTLTAAFHPDKIDASVLTLNVLLGVGTALAPVLVAVFVGLGFWWGLGVLSAILLAALLAVSLPLPLRADPPPSTGKRASLPARFWLFAAVALLYGICETLNGNWSQLYMTGTLGASTAIASIALTTFWAMVTLGRLGVEAVSRWVSVRIVYRVLPFALAGTFVLIAALPRGATVAGVAAFGLAGLCCSGMLPLTISFGQEQLATIATAMAGGVIAFYQLGYGVAAFGVGPVLDGGVKLSAIYGATAGVAIALGLFSFAVTRRNFTPIR